MRPETTLDRIMNALRRNNHTIIDSPASIRVAIEAMCEEMDRMSDEMNKQVRELSESSMWTKRY